MYTIILALYFNKWGIVISNIITAYFKQRSTAILAKDVFCDSGVETK